MLWPTNRKPEPRRLIFHLITEPSLVKSFLLDYLESKTIISRTTRESLAAQTQNPSGRNRPMSDENIPNRDVEKAEVSDQSEEKVNEGTGLKVKTNVKAGGTGDDPGGG